MHEFGSDPAPPNLKPSRIFATLRTWKEVGSEDKGVLEAGAIESGESEGDRHLSLFFVRGEQTIGKGEEI